MSETETTAVGHAPIPLLANSYDFQKLHKAADHASGLKTESGREEAFAEIAKKQALNDKVIEGLDNGALPEGTELRDVEAVDGRTVKAAVYVEAASDEQKAALTDASLPTARRRAPAAGTITTED